MNETHIKEILARHDAVLVNSHFVYTSGKHGSAYVDKDAVSPHSFDLNGLCFAIARHFEYDRIEVVVAPAVGAIALCQHTALHLSELREELPGGASREVLALYAEREEILLATKGIATTLLNKGNFFEQTDVRHTLKEKDELVVKTDKFIFKRGYGKLVKGKRVLVVEDILNTGGSADRVVKCVREAGGEVVGLGAICNRGGVSAEQLGVPKLFALLNVSLDAYEPEKCPLCKAGVPINEEVGHGKDFMASKRASAPTDQIGCAADD